jgi:DNA ligase (NAD+)
MAPNIDKIRDLIENLNKYTYLYDKGTPAISDKEWDDLYFELNKLEQETGIIYPDSPTQSINFQTVSKLNKVKHDQPPMLSLDKTKDIRDLQSFVKGQDWMGMFKLDGLSCRLVYSNGNLVQASTRGNGIEGEDITHNARVIPSIPKSIPYLDTLIVDGEIICDYNSFKKFEGEYKNPRNFAAGSIRQLSSAEAASRNLSFVAWDLIKGYDDIDFFFWRLEKLDNLGFTTVPRVGDAETIEDAIEILNDMRAEKPYGEYPIDGYVFRFESQKYYKSLGSTEHHFRGAIAYKFYDEEYETRLKYITYDVSRNGVLTPVAVFEPIDIDGSTVERASLHNMSIMKETLGRTPYDGERIWVIKSNQIIPQITRADKRDYGDIIAAGGVTVGLGGDYGILCPICGGLTSIKVSESGVETLYCDNKECPGKLAQRIDHFCGKKGLDIKGISRKTIEKLIDWGWINGFADIFRLEQHKTEWVSKEGFGTASVKKILLSIDATRSGSKMENFLSAIGIPLVGRTIAKEIVKYYSTWEEFRAAVGGDWTEFEGFGPEISKAINNFDYIEADEVAAMLAFSQPEIQNEDLQAAAIKGKTFVITGKLSRKRDDIKAEIESLGGKVTGSVSSKTDYLICNDKNSTTGKSADAKRLNIPIITEEEYQKFKNFS